MVLENRQGCDRASLPLNMNGLAGHQALLGEDGRIFAAGWCLEAIAEAGEHGARCRFIKVDIDPAPLVDEQRAQIVDAVCVVGVFMGDEHAIDRVNVGVEELHAQVR